MSETLQEKRARLRSLLEKRPDAISIPRVEPRLHRADLEPLSFAQQGLWFVSKLEGLNPAYNIPILLRLSGRLDIDALSRAISAVVRRHDSLRTRFVEHGGVPSQSLFDVAEARLEPREVTPAEAETVYRSETQRPFDIADDCLFRIKLFKEAEERFVLTVTMHHSISDAWSVGVFLREMMSSYEAYSQGREPSLKPLAVTYTDYVYWEKAWLESGVLEQQLGFWKRQLEGLSPVLTLPMDRPRPTVQDDRGGTVYFAAPPRLLEKLKSLSNDQRCSLFVTLVAALGVLLHRYSSQREFAIGTGVAHRRRPELEELIGYFVNTLVIHARLTDQSFTSLLKVTRDVVLQALANQDAPYRLVIEELRPDRSLGQAPFSQVMINLQNVPYDRRVDLFSLTMELEIPDSGAAKADLSFAIQEEKDGLRGQIEYRAEIFDEETIHRMAERYVLLLQRIVMDPEQGIFAMDLLSSAERHQVLVEANAARSLPPPEASLPTWFAERAAAAPEALAVLFAGTGGAASRALSYRELERLSARWARTLRGLGVGPDVRVGICVRRSPRMIVALLAVLRSGGAYVPLDPAWPAERLAWMLDDAGVDLILTETETAGPLLDGTTRPLLPLFLDGEPGEGPELPPELPLPTQAAYVIYTSGSTGRPKGVVAMHGGLAAFTRSMADAMALTPEDRVLLVASISFDAAAVAIWTALARGAAVVLHPDPAALSAEELLALCAAHELTVLDLPGVLWRQVMQERDGMLHFGPEVRLLMTGGESLAPEFLRRWGRIVEPEARLISSYGPTETTVTTTVFQTSGREAVVSSLTGSPLGELLPGTVIYLLDGLLNLVPPDVPGEICIGGAGMTRGYLGRPDLTAAAFLPDPWGLPGARMYRTGDSARRRPGAGLEFLGRIDQQVKIRGFRIEPSEIEEHLAAHASVSQAVVLAREDRPGEKRLVAYVVGTEGVAPDPGKLREHVTSKLPEHMVPSVFVVLPALPLMTSGKVDRRALPAPEQEDFSRSEHVAPRNELERLLCAIWQEVLGVERVGIEDRFFDLGGHSLLATQVVSRVRSALGRELPLRMIFEHPTVAGLCEKWPELSGGLVLPAIEVVAERERLPLSYAQQRLWFIDRLEGGSSHYNIAGALRVRGDLDKAAFAGAVRTIVERHESLRTVFQEVQGEVFQVIVEDVDFRVAEGDLSGLGAEDREREVRRLALADARRTFDLSRDLLFRAGLLKLAEEEHVVLLNMHHIVSDGWSVGVLLKELEALYQSHRAGAENPLEPLRLQYADYACWQRQWLRGEVLASELGYWRRQLDGLPLVHGLLTDKPRPARQGFEGSEHVQRLEGELKDRIGVFCRQREVTLFMVLQAAFAVLLSRYSQETDIVLGSPIAGRVHRDLEPLIGFFVNTLVLRSDLSGSPSFVDLLASSRQTILDAYAHQHVPFEMLVEELKPERNLSHNPLFQILIVLQNAEQVDLTLAGSPLEPLAGSGDVAKFDLELSVLELANGLALTWSHKKALFYPETIVRMAGHFQVLLAALADNAFAPVTELPLLSMAERHQTLVEANVARSFPLSEVSVLEMFAACAAAAPEAAAVLLAGPGGSAAEIISYGELERLSARWARSLRGLGVGPEARVGVCLRRSPRMIVAILAVLRAGGAYVPLDPGWPLERRAWMLDDAGVDLVFTEADMAAPLLASMSRSFRPLFLDGEPIPGPELSLEPPLAAQAAYVIYTSGSTGQPKGVVALHGGLTAFSQGMAKVKGLVPGDRELLAASLSFDASAGVIWPALTRGAAVVVHPDPAALTAAELLALCAAQRMTVLDMSGALWRQMIQEMDGTVRFGPEVRVALTGGESVGQEFLRLWAGLVAPQTRLSSAYGPTETTVAAAVFQMKGFEAARALLAGFPLGDQFPGVAIYLLDGSLAPAPLNVPDEICIGGTGVTRGYLGRPRLTAAAFLPDPWGPPGARLYRTGDCARRRPDGSLEFLGRIDQQVKIRGFRIEPGEIEAQIASHASVGEVLVLAREDRPGEKRLVAYVVGKDGAVPDSGTLRKHVAAKLPEYMVPSVVVVLPALPQTTSGKVDRRALPAPEEGDYQKSEYAAPRTELERRLCEIWAEILGVERVGIEDSFFDLGGHSLLATRVVSRVRSALGRELPLRALFENPTIRGLCEKLPELGGGVILPEIEVVADRERLPLSYAQQRLWFIDRLEGGSRQYNIPVAMRVRGGLDKAAFAAALRTVVARHEALRTVFREIQGEVIQVILEGSELQLGESDLSTLEAAEREREVRRLALEDSRRPFDLSRDLPFRIILLKLAEKEHVMLSTMHHIASDGWSVGVLAKELETLYAAYRAGEEISLPPLRVQYGDYACWQRRWLQGEVLESQMSYWRRQLDGLPTVHGLLLDKPRPARQGFEGGEHVTRLGRPLRERLEALCRERGVTLFMLLQVAVSILLSRYSQETDIVVGSPIAGRVHRDVEPLIGCFVNTLVLRGDLSGNPRLEELVAASRRMILDAYAHQHVPFEMLVEELKPKRSLSHNPLFQILLVLQNLEQGDAKLGGSHLEPLDGSLGIVKLDLELNALELDGNLSLAWWYKKELFHDATIERMAGHFEVLLTALVDRAGALVADLPLLGAAEREQMLVEWNDTGAPVAGELCLHELFAARAGETPEAVALVDGGRELTYGDLAREAYRLAHHLQSLGVGPEQVVGVCLERTAEMVVALLAVLAAGGAYLPLDPAHPQARLERVLADSGAAVVVTQESLADRLVDRMAWSGSAVVLERDRAVIARCPHGLPRSAASRESLAYVLFTSGSTGTPKGVALTHRSAVELVLWGGRTFSPAELSGVLAATALSFDLSVFELFVPLSWGGTVILAANALALPALPAAARVRLVNTVPSALAELVDAGALPAGVRTVILAGEPLSRSLADRIWATCTVEALWNLYGPSEDTTYSTFAPVERAAAATPHIGRPIAATRAYVVGRLWEHSMQPAPVGAPGELWLGGAGLARGYLGRPDLTAERFVPDPFSGEPGARLYRTGDLVRRLPAGDLEFLGRIDHQVKVRGFRIELGEIEASLATHPEVRQAVVLAREDQPGDKRLVAYVVGGATAAGLHEHLRGRLPDYMVPSLFVALPALPLTPNGKVDRRALPAPEEGDLRRGAYVAPRTELERWLCEIWEEVLGVERVGIEDSFFDLGGHSLLATRVVSRVRSALGRELPLRALFENPTIRGLCASLPGLGGGLVLPPIAALTEREGLPLSYAQQRLWFIDRLEGGSSQYNIPAALRLRGALDTEALAAAFRTIVERHESLRTVFRESNGAVVQVIREDVDFRLAEEDLRGLPEEEKELEVRRLALADARRPFDLSHDLPFRVGLLKLSEEEHVVLSNMHHIASDGWSIGVLMRELRALYEAFRAGQKNPLPPLRVQYADYAHWQRQWLRGETLAEQLGYWKRQLNGLPVVHGLPLDNPRPAQQGFAGSMHVQRLGKDLAERLATLCRQRGVTLFMALQAAFSVLLSRYSRERDIVTGSPIAGRVHRDVEPLIGFFVNTLVLRSDLSGNPRFVDLLESSRRTILDAYAHQHVPFEMLVEELKPERSLRHSPLFQILLVLQNTARVEMSLGDARFEPVDANGGIVKFDLELNAEASGDEGLLLRWGYKKELFHAATIERLAGHFAVLLAALADRAVSPVADLSLLAAAEREQMLVEWNDTGSPTGGELCLHELFAMRASEAPGALALVAGERELTYGELAQEASRLAHHLRSLGVGPEQVVGVCLERTAEMVVTLLAVLKAGGAYLPLDPAHPRARLERVLADSGAAVVVTQESLADRLVEGMNWRGPAVVLERDRGAIARYPLDPLDRLESGVSRDNLAYVLFTSGSTGTPKGVAVTHRSAVELALWAGRVFSPEDLSGVLAATSLSFDLSVFELFVPLSWGGTVILAADALALPALPAAARVRLVNTVPSALAELVRAGALPAGVRTVCLAGEPLSRSLADSIWATGTIEALWNLYGPSEDTTYSTFAAVERASVSAPRIGRPIAATRAYVVDGWDEPVPVGVAGELWLGGAGLTRGYLGRPDLTAERFVPDPFSGSPGQPGDPGTRLYRTGDLVRWLPAGELEYLGRIDHQVKVRGFRIELGEIEASLAAHPDVREAIVLAREDGAGGKRLVAYVVGGAAAAGLSEHLRARLPDYMIPSMFMALPALPLTPNGKVDRRALPAPEEGDLRRGTYVAPRTELERRLCEIWAEILGVGQVGIEDSFFDLGGHSLLATRVVSQVRAALGRELPLRALFENPTIRALCESLPELGGGVVLPTIEIVAERERLPLSYAQQRLWFIDRLEGGSSQYNIPGAMRVRGDLDKAALTAAFRTLLVRHESLRTVFQEVEGAAVQVIRKEAELAVAEIDLSALAEDARERESRRLARQDARRPFDLSRDLPLRVALLKLSEKEHVVLSTMHHIASDGWSIAVLMRELRTLYATSRTGEESPLPPLRVQYADYAYWQRQWLRGDVLNGQLGYWRRQLDGLPLVHGLPLDRPRPAHQGFEGGLYAEHLGRGLRDRIEALCRERGVTLFMFLQSAFAVLLSRYSRATDVVVGSPIAGRIHRDLEPMIGFFVNTLVLRSDLSGDLRFAELLESSKQTILDAYAHQHVPFEMLVEELKPERSLSHSPLFQVLLVLQNMERDDLELGGARLEPVDEDSHVAKLDLELNVGELAEGLELGWLYKQELFNGETIEWMASSFRVLLEDILERPEERIRSLPLLSATERLTLLGAWKGREVPYPQELCFHELLEAQVERSPDAVAVVYEEGHLTFRELNERSNRLARYLIGLGVEAETLVGLCVERSLEMLVGIFGVLKAGGAYMPLDPDSPEARLGYMLEDSAVEVVLTERRLGGLGCFAGRRTVPLDDPAFAARLEGLAAGNPDRRGLRSIHLAYMIYTSGSTGQPKGVMVEHRSVVNLSLRLREMLSGIGLEPGYRWAWNVPVVFDGSVKGLTQLALGAELHVLPQPVRQSPPALLSYVQNHSIDLLDCTPSLLDLLLGEAEREQVVLPHLLIGGEAINGHLWSRICAHLQPRGRSALNVYGPTECTVDSTATVLEDHVGPHIGRPLPNTEAYVLDAELGLAPHGGVGELHIGGEGVARGYLGRPALTAERFVANPFSRVAGARMYRTGDLVRRRGDGALEYLGRADDQVKVRGFRIELGEVEAQLRSQASVRDAVVVAREDRPGEKRLVAYVVGAAGSAPEAGRLREHMASRLPEYMVPSVFVVLAALPLTVSGKVDRRALPAPEAGDYQRGGYVAPRTELERRLCEIWEELLGVERVGIEDNFFDLGGHSLLATRVVSRVRSALGRELPLRVIFEHPEIGDLCETLPELSGGWALPAIEILAERKRVALSYAQQRLWFIDRLEGGSSEYNIPGATRAHGDLDKVAFAAALRTIVQRHESLRTVFREADGEAFQAIRDDVDFQLAELDLSRLGEEEREREVRRLAAEDARRPFDLSRDLPLRLALLRLSPEENVVLFNMHHIASDGWSMGVLMSELRTLYAAYRAGEESPLPPLRVQYADYAHWQRQWLQGEVLEGHLSYWRRQLAAPPPVHGLPLDRPRPARQGFAAGRSVQRLGRELSDRIAALGRERGVTLFMFLQVAFAVFVSRYSGETDIVMGSPIAGRVHRDLEPLIGFFVNTLVLRSDLSGSSQFAELLAAGKQMILDAYAHQHVPFEMLVEELEPERSLGHSPLFQILLVLQNTERGDVELAGARLEPVDEGFSAVKFDLELNAAELEDGLAVTWSYRTDLFDGETIERMAGHFKVLLAALADGAGEPAADLPLLHASERVQMLVEWNDTGAPAGGDLRLHELFALRAEETPEAVALVDGERELSYGELARQAYRLAHYLQSLGVGPEQVVGVCLERTAEMMVTLLAVLAAGGAYLPLDPAHPRARLERVLADSGAAVVVHQESLAERLPWRGPAVVLERDRAVIGRCPYHRPASCAPRESLAYVLFTSGSTGTPKGVAVTHRSAVELVLWAGRVFSPAELSGVLAATSLSFDLSVFELFVPLSWGGTVILAANPLALPGLPAAARVRLINTVPSALAELVQMGGLPAGARTVNLAGEPLLRSLADRIWATGTVDALWNLYGPSEDTTYSTFARVERASSAAPRIGRPIAATRAYVVDRRGGPVPVGVAGELWLGGAGLARGYLGRPDLTAERFIPDPFAGNPDEPGARLYRTGDLVRRLPGGDLELLGRSDHQVKVRGFRIELGEIESALAAYPEVREAVVLAREDQPGDKRLVAYVVGGAEAAGLREHLRGRLPEYMIPSAFVALDDLPRTPNGKVDRKALPDPREDRSGQEAVYVVPRDTLELELVRLWEEILAVQPIGVQDSFFSLGGHSLLAVRLVARMSRRLGRELSLLELFQNPTIESLARSLRSRHEAQPGSQPSPASPIVALQAAGHRRPFFCVHPGGGTVLAYVLLSRHLGPERPFYGLQARELLDGGAPGDDTVEAMAGRYVAAVREAQPAGPYLLGGWSLGGVIAYEMARQLREAGEEIELLALIDAHVPKPRPSSAEHGGLPLWSTFAQNLGLSPEQLPVTAAEVQGMSADERLALLVDQGRRLRVLPPDIEVEGLRNLFRTFSAHVQSMESYAPRSFDGRLTLYRAADGKDNGHDALGWSRLALRGVEVREIQGNHFTVMREPAVAELAARLAEDLP